MLKTVYIYCLLWQQYPNQQKTLQHIFRALTTTQKLLLWTCATWREFSTWQSSEPFWAWPLFSSSTRSTLWEWPERPEFRLRKPSNRSWSSSSSSVATWSRSWKGLKKVTKKHHPTNQEVSVPSRKRPPPMGMVLGLMALWFRLPLWTASLSLLKSNQNNEYRLLQQKIFAIRHTFRRN